jgi:acid phosphatase type 7
MRWIVLLLASSLIAKDATVYLSLQDDPSCSMAIHWHTPVYDPRFDAVEETANTVSYFDGEAWREVEGTAETVEQTVVHTVRLQGLAPNTTYAFQVSADKKTYHFRTLPAQLDSSVRFFIGGDVYASAKMFRRMSKTAMEHKPHFAILSGDLAHSLSLHLIGHRRWMNFLKDWQECMVDEEGVLLPFLVVAPHGQDRELLTQMFALPKFYRTVDIASYLSLVVLDSANIETAQTDWLASSLDSRGDRPYCFAVYHEAAYPSFCPEDTSTLDKIREHWVPLFEKHRVSAVFESHSQAFKRTYPLKDGQIDPTGIAYIGDGSWGAIPHKANLPWYLAKRSGTQCLLLVELSQEGASVQTFDMKNRLLDVSLIASY